MCVGRPHSLVVIQHRALYAYSPPQDARLPAVRRQTWEAFMRLHAEGRVRAIGVSNYLPHHLDEICAPGVGDWAALKPQVNQFELHPMLQQRDVVEACERYGIAVEAYSSLGQVGVNACGPAGRTAPNRSVCAPRLGRATPSCCSTLPC